jgi:hypothetical protein
MQHKQARTAWPRAIAARFVAAPSFALSGLGLGLLALDHVGRKRRFAR